MTKGKYTMSKKRKASDIAKRVPVKFDEARRNEFKRSFKISGGNITQACAMSGIAHDTYYEYIKRDPGFKVELERIKNYRNELAESNVIEKLEKGDDFTSRWLLEKTNANYNPKTLIESKSVLLNLNKDLTDLSDDDLMNLIKNE